MTRQEVSRLMAQGEALDREGHHAEAERAAAQLLSALYEARSLRRGGGGGLRKADLDATAWAQSIIEKYHVSDSSGWLH